MPENEGSKSATPDTRELTRATEAMIRSAQNAAAREAAEPKPSK